MSIRKKYFVELEEINQKLLLMQKKSNIGNSRE